VTGIVNNILYAIDAFEKQFKSLIKLSISVVLVFSLGKISYNTLILKINQYHQDQKNYHVLKNLQHQRNTFSNYHNPIKLASSHQIIQ
jgi:hypothetical protein